MTIYKKYQKAYDVLKSGLMDYEGDKPVQRIYERFTSEYGWNIKRIGFYKALTEWLQGLALDIPYNYHDIMETFGLPEKQCESYWRFMAIRLQELFKDEKLI